MTTSTMADPQDLLTLAAKVEAATGPDRELDVAIFNVIAGGRYWPEYASFWRYEEWRRIPVDFTASLDAAMTLVDGADWTLSCAAYEPCLTTIPSGDDRVDAVHGYAATPVLALAAAALRARAAIREGESADAISRGDA